MEKACTPSSTRGHLDRSPPRRRRRRRRTWVSRKWWGLPDPAFLMGSALLAPTILGPPPAGGPGSDLSPSQTHHAIKTSGRPSRQLQCAECQVDTRKECE
jgi:hypothetical protein